MTAYGERSYTAPFLTYKLHVSGGSAPESIAWDAELAQESVLRVWGRNIDTYI
jgi:hypothetical protein